MSTTGGARRPAIILTSSPSENGYNPATKTKSCSSINSNTYTANIFNDKFNIICS
jgi:hypothetical protein